MSETIIVGEQNPYGADPHFALYPAPEMSAGARLCRILGLSRRAYLDLFDRANLLTASAWSVPAARAAAAKIAHPQRVLLGARVSAAFGLAFEPFTVGRVGEWTYAILPHPSGRCRIWNNPASEWKARKAVSKLIGRDIEQVREASTKCQ
jgi:hypothetical protein